MKKVHNFLLTLAVAAGLSTPALAEYHPAKASELLATAYQLQDNYHLCADAGLDPSTVDSDVREMEKRTADAWPDKAPDLFKKGEAIAHERHVKLVTENPYMEKQVRDAVVTTGRSGPIVVNHDVDEKKARCSRIETGLWVYRSMILLMDFVSDKVLPE